MRSDPDRRSRAAPRSTKTGAIEFQPGFGNDPNPYKLGLNEDTLGPPRPHRYQGKQVAMTTTIAPPIARPAEAARLVRNRWTAASVGIRPSDNCQLQSWTPRLMAAPDFAGCRAPISTCPKPYVRYRPEVPEREGHGLIIPPGAALGSEQPPPRPGGWGHRGRSQMEAAKVACLCATQPTLLPRNAASWSAAAASGAQGCTGPKFALPLRPSSLIIARATSSRWAAASGAMSVS
jgi:hypothetical protein